jgi:OFA family oxalate/formate antiporter-like MFS transporter
VLIGLGWALAWAFGESYAWLWFSIGVLLSAGTAVGYLCPLATAVKWFPNRPGLVSGLAAAGFAGGPIVLSSIAEALMRRGWPPISIFGFLAATYAPAVLLVGMMLTRPAGQPGHAEVVSFHRRTLLGDRRFWTLWAGMFAGTLPYIVVAGNAKPLAVDWGLGGSPAAVVITVLAVGNAIGRVSWGMALDRVGPRRAMLSAQVVMIVSLVVLLALGRLTPIAFFLACFGVGFCYGSNFAIYPATVTRLYGAHVLGSVYPFIMVAQGLSSFAATLNGFLKDATASNTPGLCVGLAAALAGLAVCAVLRREG